MELPDLQLRGDLKVIPFRKSHAQFIEIQIVVDCNNDSAYQFAKAIGFEVEGIMRKVGPDKANHFLMSRIET
jgi:hypothetical protein